MINQTQPQTSRLTDWVIQKIKTEYPEDIALLIGIKGHSTNGDDHGESFDYFVPETKRGEELARTFLIAGVGHDLYPRSWERLEKSAQLEDMSILLANATILYARSKKDIRHFEDIRGRLYQNLSDPAFTGRKAAERVREAKEIFLQLCFEKKQYRVRMLSAFVTEKLSQAAAYLNGTFAEDPLFSEAQAYDSCPESRIYSCPDLSELPDGFFRYARRLLTTDDPGEIRENSRRMIEVTEEFLMERRCLECQELVRMKPECIKPDCMPEGGSLREPEKNGGVWAEFASWYQELSLTWLRIRYFSEHGMTEKAFCDAAYLQEELIEVARHYGILEYNLLDSFDADHLEFLRLRADKIESDIRDLIDSKGVKIQEYDTLEEFLEEMENETGTEFPTEAEKYTEAERLVKTEEESRAGLQAETEKNPISEGAEE